jgi:hypothetical protein
MVILEIPGCINSTNIDKQLPEKQPGSVPWAGTHCTTRLRPSKEVRGLNRRPI